MKTTLARVIKSYCDDFTSIRINLNEIGAELVESKEQEDIFFHLPGSKTKRLKLRLENNQPRVMHFYRRKNNNSQVTFETISVSDPNIVFILENALGIQKRIKKFREVWHKGTAVFNLDVVENIGNIFEIELEKYDTKTIEYYKNLFSPYIGKEIMGSNEDLVRGFKLPVSSGKN